MFPSSQVACDRWLSQNPAPIGVHVQFTEYYFTRLGGSKLALECALRGMFACPERVEIVKLTFGGQTL